VRSSARAIASAVIVLAIAAAAGSPAARTGAAEPAPPAVRIDQVDGTSLAGGLVRIDGDSVRIVTDSGERSLPLATIRRLVHEAGEPAPRPTVRIALADGGTLAGADFVQEGEQGVITGDTGRVELPIPRVRQVAWLTDQDSEPAWVAALPEPQTADLVAVRRDDGHAFVECAIAGVSAESVTVVLDGETIPVKRAKILGLAWLREEAAPAGTVVDVAGGRLTADRVEWSPAGLVLDAAIRLPAAALRAIDYAAGRTTPLAAVAAEKTTVEPFFGGLAAEPGLAAFFAPRMVPDPEDHGPAVLVVRPRTAITWRLPADSRRFRGRLARDPAAQASAAVDVSLAVDGRELVRRRLGGSAADEREPVPLDLDLQGGRRLTLTVDFVPGTIGCGLRLVEGAFEK
jgi:hypothetical protein